MFNPKPARPLTPSRSLAVAALVLVSSAALGYQSSGGSAADSAGKPQKPDKGGKKPSQDGKKGKPPSASSQPGKLSEPLSGIGLQGTFGWYRIYGTNKSQTFYSIGYRGSTLFSGGQQYSGTAIGSQDPIDFGDQPIFLKIDGGKTSLGGTLIQNLNAIRMPLLKLSDPNALRLLIGFDAQTEKRAQQNLLLGVEFRPKLTPDRPPTTKGGDTSGQHEQERLLAFGFATEKHSGVGSSQTIPTGIFRGRLGAGFQLVASSRRVDESKRNTAIVLGQIEQQEKKLEDEAAQPVPKGAGEVPHEDRVGFDDVRVNVRSLANRFGINPPIGPTAKGAGEPVRQSLAGLADDLDAYQEPAAKGGESPNDAIMRIARAAKNKLELLQNVKDIAGAFLALDKDEARKSIFRNQPLISAYTEFDGGYALNGSSAFGKYRSIWSGNIRLDLDPNNEKAGYIWLRYENGFCRAEPNRRSNSLILTFGWSF